ncbi:MAG TPA: DUF4160 domain-containing protein [Longimicrobium sp.]|jgi:hypothetical protein
MPTIYVVDGFRVEIYTRDHRPPHVHVFYRDGEAIIGIGESGQDPEVRSRYNLRTWEVARALDIVRENQAAFREAWREYHGY